MRNVAHDPIVKDSNHSRSERVRGPARTHEVPGGAAEPMRLGLDLLGTGRQSRAVQTSEWIKVILENFFLGLGALFPMVNPFSTIPLLLALTAGLDERARAAMAGRAVRNAVIIMLVALAAGTLVLEFFNISVSALRIAGGLIVAYLGFRMLFPPPEAEAKVVRAGEGGQEVDFSFIPLALPSLAGAGTLAMIITFSTEIDEQSGIVAKVLGYGIASAVILTVGVIAWVVLRSAGRILRVLGAQGLEALTRIMGLLMVCIGVQFVGMGVSSFAGENVPPEVEQSATED